MTEAEKELIIKQFLTNRKGFYAWLFKNNSRAYLVNDLRTRYPDAKSDLECAYRLVFNIEHPPVCPVCGKQIPFIGARSLNKTGYNDHCCHKCGTLDPHHQQAIKNTKRIKYGDQNWNNAKQATNTCKQKYGGNGIRGDRKKAKQTMLERYGVECFLNSDYINNIRNNRAIQQKIQESKRINNSFNTSKPEEDCYKYLCKLYGKSNVVRQYKDNKRYPFNCDFYIISEDLFIELNLFPTHGKEPFDTNNIEHQIYLEHCKTNPSNWVEQQLPLIWAGTDVLKLAIATQNNLHYLQFYSLEKLKEVLNEKSRIK